MLYSVLFRFGHIRRSDQCAVYILYSKISTDPGLPLKIQHSHRFVAVVIQFLIPLKYKQAFKIGFQGSKLKKSLGRLLATNWRNIVARCEF